MNTEIQESRRGFLKLSATGAAGVMAGSVLPKSAFASSANAWVDGMQVNPNIDNTKLVLIKDSSIVYSNDKLWPEMDQAARVLAGKSTVDEAWTVILRKPTAKAWADVKVALKGQWIWPAVMCKIIDVLHTFGVPYENMWTWRSVSEAYPVGTYLPAGVHNVLGNTMGTLTPVPVKVSGVTRNVGMVGYLASGFFDIQVNFATNGQHDVSIGHKTLCMKNNFGCFDCLNYLSVMHGPEPAAMLEVNKLDAFYGGNPVRQQLCIIAGERVANLTDDFVAMGTFAPALDYVWIKKVGIALEGDMQIQQSVISNFATSYGYTVEQFDALDFIDYQTDPATGASYARPGQSTHLQVLVSHPAFKQAGTNIEFPFEGMLGVSAVIYDQKGRVVREMKNSLRDGTKTIVWDGLSSSGVRVQAGMYVIKIFCAGVTSTGSLMLATR